MNYFYKAKWIPRWHFQNRAFEIEGWRFRRIMDLFSKGRDMMPIMIRVMPGLRYTQGGLNMHKVTDKRILNRLKREYERLTREGKKLSPGKILELHSLGIYLDNEPKPKGAKNEN